MDKQISEKLDTILVTLQQLIEIFNQVPLPILAEQITLMTTLFDNIPELIKKSTDTTAVSTEEIIVELKLISAMLESIKTNTRTSSFTRKEKGKEKVIIYPKNFWP